MEGPFVTILQLTLVLLFVFLNAFFVAAEFALVKIRSSRLEALVQEGSTRARYAQKLVLHLETALSVTQLGITLASLGLGWIGEPVVAELLHPVMHSLGISPSAGETISFIIAFSLITALHIVLGELIPKNLAIRKAESVVLGTALPMLLIQKLFYPFVWLLNRIADTIAQRLGFGTAQGTHEPAHTEDEIRLLMAESHRQGYIDKTELDFMDNIFEFADLTARDIMVPRTEMACLYLEDSIEEQIAAALKLQLTRYPVYRKDKDHIIGFLHIKDLLLTLSAGQQTALSELARKALFVPESISIKLLLKNMQKNRAQLAIVTDEYGGTAGMITIEDILEEIVGDIEDEFDQNRKRI